MANLKLWQSLGFAAQFAVGAAVPSPVARLTLLLVVFCASFGCLAFMDRSPAPCAGADAAGGARCARAPGGGGAAPRAAA